MKPVSELVQAVCEDCSAEIPNTFVTPDELEDGLLVRCEACEREVDGMIAEMERRWALEDKTKSPLRSRRRPPTAPTEVSLRRLKKSFDHLP